MDSLLMEFPYLVFTENCFMTITIIANIYDIQTTKQSLDPGETPYFV